MSGKKKTRFLWITDPWDTLEHSRDTTLRLAEEALSLGHTNHWTDVKSIRLEEGEILFSAQKIEAIYPGRTAKSIHLGPLETFNVEAFDSLQYRTDPPVDLSYLHPLQLLSTAIKRSKKSIEFVNPMDVLFAANEKLEPALLGSLMPATVISSQWSVLQNFGKGRDVTVLKPLHQAQSKGVELLKWRSSADETHSKSALERATEGFQRPALLQEYLPGIQKGEQRLWFLDGKLLATARKLPLGGDFRVNIDGGSKMASSSLTVTEKRAALRIGALLKKKRIRLAAVDLIDAKITDFNFTSPGLITQMETISGRNLARPIIQALAKPWPGLGTPVKSGTKLQD